MAALEAKLREERKRADDQALYYAGIFLLYVDRVDKVNRSREGGRGKGVEFYTFSIFG